MPRAKQAAGKNPPYGLRISEVRVEVHGLVGADPRHSQALDIKFDGQFAGFQSIDDELRMVADKLIDDDFYFAVLRPHVIQLVAVFSRRQIQLQSFDVDGVDMFRSSKKLPDSEIKAEFAHTDDGLKAGFVVVRVSLSENSQARAGDLKSLHERDVKRVQLNFALKSCRQCFDDGGAQDRLSARDSDSNNGENYDH